MVKIAQTQTNIMADAKESSEVVEEKQQEDTGAQAKEETQKTEQEQADDYEDDDGELVRPEPYADRPPIGKYEYLDHTADVQLHSWGDSLKESFEQVVLAMFDYMTDVSLVEKKTEEVITVDAEDFNSLLFHFLDEWLFLFSADPFFIPREVVIEEFDMENFKIKCRGYGETFDLMKHPQGTEVKAITYSNMQVHDKDPSHDIYVIIDI